LTIVRQAHRKSEHVIAVPRRPASAPLILRCISQRVSHTHACRGYELIGIHVDLEHMLLFRLRQHTRALLPRLPADVYKSSGCTAARPFTTCLASQLSQQHSDPGSGSRSGRWQRRTAAGAPAITGIKHSCLTVSCTRGIVSRSGCFWFLVGCACVCCHGNLSSSSLYIAAPGRAGRCAA
jgi:hypothetical protein